MNHDYNSFKGELRILYKNVWFNVFYIDYLTTQKVCQEFGFQSGTLSEQTKSTFNKLDIIAYEFQCFKNFTDLTQCRLIFKE